uniref:rRNA-processing protein EFG1 n=1 Tax=Noctiluca scintillans TaxID=2966 RepID=A0A7S1AF66_NOCSC|mmetsp:Transcript_43866/g.115864  ORF Transcript_43866/g.115864 Transcript_43866/m.115864 type:complete len:233 (+) Transcript_43866:87-785(+)
MAEDAGGLAPKGQRERRKMKRDPTVMPRSWEHWHNAETWRRRELEQRNCSRYHYVKFVEKQKVTRKLKTTRRLLEGALEGGEATGVEALREQLKAHLLDFEYIDKYPRHLPYTCLFPREDNDAQKARRATIRRLIDDAQQPKRRKNAKHIVASVADGKLIENRMHGAEDASEAEKNEDESPPKRQDYSAVVPTKKRKRARRVVAEAAGAEPTEAKAEKSEASGGRGGCGRAD